MGTDTALAVEKPSVLEQTIQVDEIQTRYLTAGDGPPLVLLHGAGDSARAWSWVLPLLGRSHQVLAPDLPGYSPGSVPADDCSPARLARFVARFLDAVGLDRVAVAGNSLGGLAALQLALAEPERVTALCLVDSAGLGRAVNAARQPGFLEATVASLRAVLGPFGQRQVLVRRLPALTMPTLIVWGTADRVIPITHGRRAVRRVSRGSLVQLSRCGHAPQVECPDSFTEALSRFLQAVGQR